jgi:hypothetical protein
MKHIHRYLRVKLGGKKIWRCSIPGCTHYLRHEMAMGQNSICWVCGNTMVLTPKIMLCVKPHCDNGVCWTRPSIAKNRIIDIDWNRVIEEAG